MHFGFGEQVAEHAARRQEFDAISQTALTISDNLNLLRMFPGSQRPFYKVLNNLQFFDSHIFMCRALFESIRCDSELDPLPQRHPGRGRDLGPVAGPIAGGRVRMPPG